MDVTPFETDLCDTNNVLNLANYVNMGYQLGVLINNAGTGGSHSFLKADVHYINRIVQLNVVATALLTHQLLPNLMTGSKSFILNVSSMAAFTPVGFKTVYPASKSFVHSFSRGLYAELRDTNVFVSVVNPGAMRTNAEITGRIDKQGWLGRITLLDPDKVARKCLRRLFRRDTVIMLNPLSWLMLHFIPVWISLPLMTKVIKRELGQ